VGGVLPEQPVERTGVDAVPPHPHASEMPPGVHEADLQEHCEAVARAYGWLVHHAADSRRADPGLPDLIMLSPVQPDGGVTLVMLELKTAKGKLTDEQEQWQLRLALVKRVVTGVLRPAGWRTYVALACDPSEAVERRA